jgi:ACS family hexuronate transporter-like MFS transporter
MPIDVGSPTTASESTHPKPRARGDIYPWVVCGLLFLATTISYLDRTVLSILAPDLQKRFHISEIQYGYLGSAFTVCYALSQLLSGALLDRIGTRLGFLLAMICWSAASMAHAACRNTMQFFIARAALGVSESPAFPGAAKGIAEWFPADRRALAMGVINAGSNVGILIAAIMVPWLMSRWGWQSVFIMTGAFGFAWVLLWAPIYRNPVKPLPADGEVLQPPAHVRWRSLLKYRQTWALCAGKIFTDPAWWFYVNWLPKFMNEHHSIDIAHIGPPLLIIYAMADIGSISGGWISSALLDRGWSVNAARKTAMLICALCALPMIGASHVSSVWIAAVLIGTATAAHQGYSSNLYALVSDAFPSNAVSTIAGMAGTCGYLGAMLMSALIGYILTWRHQSYDIVFTMVGVLYLASIIAMHAIAPSFGAVELPQDSGMGGPPM